MDKRKTIEDINIYEFMKSLNEEEIQKLILNAKTKEEATFYIKISEYLLQENQKKIIKEGIY